jgi:hypothetical protein|tara:strand:+ start:53 stop:838 length:786 start_codon:yes stop_codon:yes gene_type:complete
MKLEAVKIQSNWIEFMSNIDTHISSPRKEKLVEFYEKYQERVILMPASHKKEYHSAFPGGYVDHVNRVVKAALSMSGVWESFGCDMTTFTTEELVFSAINHDLGKMGSEDEESYITQDDKWRREKLGEDYKFNTKVPFASVPDRGLFMLQSHGITYTFNEMLAIQTHDGLYDDANKKYLMTYMPEQKPRTSLPFILHQADMMAARIEFEVEWLPKFKNSLDTSKKNFTLGDNNKKQHTTSTRSKALGSIKSEGLKNIFDKL